MGEKLINFYEHEIRSGKREEKKIKKVFGDSFLGRILSNVFLIPLKIDIKFKSWILRDRHG